MTISCANYVGNQSPKDIYKSKLKCRLHFKSDLISIIFFHCQFSLQFIVAINQKWFQVKRGFLKKSFNQMNVGLH